MNIKKKGNKKGLIPSEIAWWIIALLVLAFIAASIYLSRKEGVSLIDTIINFLRFGR